MNFLKIVAISVFASSLGGCAFMNATSRSLGSSDGPQMLVWHPDYSAGVGREGKLCVQGARTATASAYNAAIDIAEQASSGIGYAEAVRSLNPSNPQVTFANNAYFAICQLAINRVIDESVVPELIKYVTKKSLEVDTDSSEGSVMAAPDVVSIVSEVLNENGIEVSEEMEKEMTEALEEADSKNEEKSGEPDAAI